MVRDSLKEADAAPERLELEIAENVVIGSTEEALEILKRLRELGVRLVMDDFGTGYSSLSYLQKFTIDKLKVDKSFISELAFDGSKCGIVRAIVELGHGLGMETCAEGVETEEQLRLLAEEGSAEVQGFLLARPRRRDELSKTIGTSVAVGGSANYRPVKYQRLCLLEPKIDVRACPGYRFNLYARPEYNLLAVLHGDRPVVSAQN
jgi:EAL domain-containing protein (putative c-di-GMP-specific phosphodiesterase class I)